MSEIQVIQHHGACAAIVFGDRVVLAEHLRGADREHVQAKALYALEIADGERRGPYADDDAERFARAVLAMPRAAGAACHRSWATVPRTRG